MAKKKSFQLNIAISPQMRSKLTILKDRGVNPFADIKRAAHQAINRLLLETEYYEDDKAIAKDVEDSQPEPKEREPRCF